MALKLIRHTDGLVYVTGDVAAIICDTTPLALQNWRKQENPPPFNDELKAYPLRELGVWVRTELLLKKGKGGNYPYLPDTSKFPGHGVMPGTKQTTGRVDKNQAEIRLKTLQADKVEMELRQTAGELIPVEDVTKALTDMVMRVKTRLLKIPTALTPVIFGLSDKFDVQKRLEEGVRDALEELSENWRNLEVDDSDG